jgi:hypothetical protein
MAQEIKTDPFSPSATNPISLEGLWLKVEWLWQEPLPPLMSVLKKWGLVKE